MMKSDWHVYPASYKDRLGTELTSIFNDGATLEMEIRGVHFRGGDFDALSPAPDTPPSLLQKFTLNREELCYCTIACDIPQVVATPATRYLGVLHVEMRLGRPNALGGIDEEAIQLKLAYGDGTVTLLKPDDWFEGAFLKLQEQMPVGHYLVNCFGCEYSDYFYGGHGFFGSMACFRGYKAEYLAVRTKDDYIAVWDKNTESVQEIGICPEFTRRNPKTGYRG